MNLSALLPALRTLPEYPGLLEHIGRNPVALGLPRAARLPVVAALAADLQRPALLIAARSDRALLFNEELPAWLPIQQQSAFSHQPSARFANDPLSVHPSALRLQPSSFIIHHFPEPNPLPYEHAPWGPRTIRQRIATLASLVAPHPADSSFILQPSPFIISSARALLTRTLPRRDYLAAARTLRIGQSIRLDKLLESWIGAGYTSDTIVSEPGQFSRRGGIVDVWPPADTYPTRIELFGDEIEHLRRFDPASQRSGDGVDSVTVTPAREVLIKNGPRAVETQHAASPQHAASLPDNIAPDLDRLAEGAAFPTLEFYLPLLHTTPASLLDYLPDNTLIFIDDWSDLAGTVAELETQALELRADALNNGLIAPDFPAPNLSWSDLQDDLARLPLIHLGHLADELITALPISLGDHFTPGPRFGGQIDHILDHLITRHETFQRNVSTRLGIDHTLDHLITRHTAPDAPTLLVTRQAARMAELWGEHDAYLPPTEHLPDPLPPLAFVPGALSDGFTLRLPSATLSLLTDSELFGWARPEPRRRPHAPEPARAPDVSYADFAPGDYIVHVDYGIGRYTGLVKRTLDGYDREYIHLQYEGGDDLYVPIIQADRLSKYIGANETPPGLSRLGTAEWVAARTRAQQAAEEVARELLDLYAKRETIPGRAFAPDTVWQGELEAAFGYIETPDQLKAINDVKRDMEHPRPMDRLICGDVGYGKTEVALRAAFKAVNDGAQVAVLVPTTVLAQQHFNTFRQRLAAYPVKVEMLSRFRTHAEQEEILRNTHSGEVDILIGTHRLIQKDVAFANLGLLVIDEEQRFGVTHKERLKQMRTEVDVLTLTATPIPRTLYMSLAGIRDISMIQTPPDERLPVITHVGPYNERVVRQAVLRELDRGGQIFFVHNRVQSIDIARRKLQTLVPEARIGVGHGQMDERQLAAVMDAFSANEIDILLCTSIIESGLDIPNANTLIIDRADMFGLAQLYQLRGRVGRGANRAYAYFFHDKHHRMTPEARQRLETIAEQTELGAGYSIAMRDLEMRGAGDLLGARQHGHISAVGFHLYTRLLAQAVQNLKLQTSNFKSSNGTPFGVWNLEFGVSVDLPIPATLPAEYIPDRNLRLKLYRRLADIKDEQGIADIAAELADRFGRMPKPVENLLYQIKVKILAQRAAVEAVASESGQIVLRSRLWETDEGREAAAAALGAAGRIGKGKAWLARLAEGAAKSWKEQLVESLEQLAQWGRSTERPHV